MTVIFLEPARFPEEYNFSDSVVGLAEFGAGKVVWWSIRDQTKYFNRALDALGSRFRLPPVKDRNAFGEDRNIANEQGP